MYPFEVRFCFKTYSRECQEDIHVFFGRRFQNREIAEQVFNELKQFWLFAQGASSGTKKAEIELALVGDGEAFLQETITSI